MLSSLYCVQSQTTRNYTITKHFNEHNCVPSLIKDLPIYSIVIIANPITHFEYDG